MIDFEREENFKKLISLELYKKKVLSVEDSYQIAACLSNRICIFCWSSTEESNIVYLDKKFKDHYKNSDSVLLTTWLADDAASPGDWRESILYLFPSFYEKIDTLRLSAVGLIIVMNHFWELFSARYNYDFTPVIFFLKTMFFTENTNFFGWKLYNEILSQFFLNPKDEDFQFFEYESSISPQEKEFSLQKKISKENFAVFSKRLSHYGVSPSVDHD